LIYEQSDIDSMFGFLSDLTLHKYYRTYI